MKMRKIFAGMSALAIAATMAIGASADYTIPSDKLDKQSDGSFWAYVFGGNDQQNPKLYSDKEELKGISKIKIKVTFTDTPDQVDGWYGGAYGDNAKFLGWNQKASWTYDPENLTLEGEWDVTYEKLFEDVDDDYFQVWLQTWYGEGDENKVTPVTDVEFTLVGVDAPKDAPVEETPAPVEENPAPAPTGAAACLALAGIAVAGAAFVATKRK